MTGAGGGGASMDARQRVAIVASAAALSAWALDTAGTTVALPAIQSDLGLSITASQWVLNLAFLALAGLVTLGGWLGDRHGRLPMFRAGLLVFVVGAGLGMFAGLSAATPLLYVSRFVVGAGAALFIPAGTALLIDLFPPEQRGSAMGRAFGVTMLVTTVGPALSGILVQTAGWPWVFGPGLVAALVALAALTRLSLPMPERRPDAPRLDAIGAILLFLAVATLIDGFMQAGADGLTAPNVLAAIVAGVIFGILWVVWELRTTAPLLDPRIVRARPVLVMLIVVFMRFLPSALGGAFLARYVQQVLDFPPAVTGFAMMPATLATFAVAGAAGKLLDRVGIRIPVIVAMACLSGSAALYAIGYGNESYLVLAAGMVVGGIGLAYSNNVQPYAIGSVAPDERGGIAAIAPLAGQFATALWLAVLTAGLVALDGSGDAAGQVSALRTMGWAAAIVLAIAGFVVVALIPKPSPTVEAAPAETAAS